MKQEVIYYIGIGAFGYAVFFDDENGKEHIVSGPYSTFTKALQILRRDYVRSQ